MKLYSFAQSEVLIWERVIIRLSMGLLAETKGHYPKRRDPKQGLPS
jgi:hypothetical protein